MKINIQMAMSSPMLKPSEVCQLYNRGTKEVGIKNKRAATFRRGKKSLDGLPPTQDALHLHIKRAHLQTFIWKKAPEPCLVLPSPEGMDGTVKKVFSSVHWSLCYRYRQDAYNWHIVGACERELAVLQGVASVFSCL